LYNKKNKSFMSLPKSLEDFMGIHKGEKIIVCGCGTSLPEILPYKDEFVTIGVNDVPALFDPTYLLVTDHPNRFFGARRDIVQNAKSRFLFTCTSGWRHPRMVRFELGTKGLKSLDSPRVIDHFLNSPYVGVNLAYKMGAKHIGLLGVDFTDGHFYNPKDGPHPISPQPHLSKVNTAYQILLSALEERGVTFHNLSAISKVELPKITIQQFKEL
jgi:hypothetical protein